MFYGKAEIVAGTIGKIYSRFLIMVILKNKKSLNEVLNLTLRIKKYSSRLYDELLDAYEDMSNGGCGGPYMSGYTWTTVREYHYRDWTDNMFKQLMENINKHEE
jgi:hypothetical protein